MITVEGKKLTNFGSCSYLGLEFNPELKAGTIDAVERFGTQFSSSRTFASIGLYAELEGLLSQMYEKPVLVTASTTLGHLAALPVIVSENDAVVLDMQVHSSIQMAAQLLKAQNIPVTIIRHNDMERLEQKIVELKAKHDKVWYFADGIYSMYGDSAPLEELETLLDKYPQFHLYIDDAHGMSWTGKNGVGHVRHHMDHHDRMVLAISLNKAFSASGGALVFPNAEMEAKVRNCGGTLIFSGPIQPPMLGTAIAAAKLHMREDFIPLQDKVKELYQFCNDKLTELGLPQFMKTDSPLFFIPTGLPKITYNLIKRMFNEGFFLNAGSFPAVPMKRGGIRFITNGNLSKEDVSNMLERLAFHYRLALEEEGSSLEEVSKVFRIPKIELNLSGEDAPAVEETDAPTSALKVELKRSIKDLNQAEWDKLFHNKGNFTATSLEMIESVFSNRPEKENNWDFYYLIVRDQQDQPVLASFYTTSLIKEDMFSPAEISERIEAVRVDDPYHLTTTAVMLGSSITKGEHLFLDRSHPEWKQALGVLVAKMQATRDEIEAGQLMVRDFVGTEDEALRNAFMEMGLTSFALQYL